MNSRGVTLSKICCRLAALARFARSRTGSLRSPYVAASPTGSAALCVLSTKCNNMLFCVFHYKVFKQLLAQNSPAFVLAIAFMPFGRAQAEPSLLVRECLAMQVDCKPFI